MQIARKYFLKCIWAIAVLNLNAGVCQSQTPTLANAQQVNAGKITKVTLYRKQALVTREIAVAASATDREILIGSLPENVVLESVFAEGVGEIQIRGVRVAKASAISSGRSQDPELTASLQSVDQEIAELQQQLQTLKKQSNYVDNLMNFSAVATNGDLSRGVLNSQALTELSQFAMQSQKSLVADQFQTQQRLSSAVAKKAKIDEQMALENTNRKPLHEATIVVAKGAQGTLQLSYLVDGCSWEPNYTILGATSSDNINLRYNAQIQQMSGEDWSQARLTLSTASPNMSAAGPSLTPFRVAATKHVAQQGRSSHNAQALNDSNAIDRLQSLLQKQSEVASNVADFSDNDNLERDLALNEVANDFQSLELQSDAAQLKSLAADVSSQITSQSYDIPSPISLASRREHHHILVIEARVQAKLYHVATPLLSSFAFREAQFRNQRPEGLLGGPATVYLDDKFVGRIELPSTASGQLMVVGFGADPQVRTRRELVSKTEEIQGGNRKLTMNYRLVVANFKKSPVNLRMIDRLPLATQGADIRIDLNPANPPLSKDGLYLRMQKPRGILRWDIDVEPEKFGEKAHDLLYDFSLSFDRTTSLTTTLGGTEQMQQDLFESAAPSSSGMGGMGGMGGGIGGHF